MTVAKRWLSETIQRARKGGGKRGRTALDDLFLAPELGRLDLRHDLLYTRNLNKADN